MLAPYKRCVVGSSRPPAHGEARTSADPSDAEGISAAATSRARLIAPSPAQLDPLRWASGHPLARDRDVMAYGGWTDPERQRPVGQSGRHEPMAIDVIYEDELRR